MDLKGASMTIDTGCASLSRAGSCFLSLRPIINDTFSPQAWLLCTRAALTLKAGQSRISIVAGVELLLYPDQAINMSAAGVGFRPTAVPAVRCSEVYTDGNLKQDVESCWTLLCV